MGVLSAYMSVDPLCAWCLQKQAEGVKFHGIGVTDFSMWSCEYWELKLGPRFPNHCATSPFPL